MESLLRIVFLRRYEPPRTRLSIAVPCWREIRGAQWRSRLKG